MDPESGGFSLWRRIRCLFFQTGLERAEERRIRLQALTRSIEIHPDAAINYLLRGELHLELHQWDLAHEDLLNAFELAQMQWSEDRWGIAAQLVMDRAEWLLDTALPDSSG
jgi:hypothetical protein